MEVEVEVEVEVERRWVRGWIIVCVIALAAHRIAERLFASRDGICESEWSLIKEEARDRSRREKREEEDEVRIK